MKKEYSTVITTCPDKNSAKKIANRMVENRLVACVQMFPIESVYRWKNEICNENEIVLFMKSKPEMFDKIVATIKENHTYEVPEIIQIPITDGLPEYLNWIDDCVEKLEPQ